MQFYVESLNTVYEMNDRNARLILRDDLLKAGFFKYKEHDIYWKLLEEKGAGVEQATDFAKAIKVFNHVKLKKGPIN